MMIARHVRVRGRVQGVWFRAWTREQAAELGAAGWVRNCPDGSVEAHFEGDKRAVEQLIDRISSGPPGARVDDVQVETTDPAQLGSFDVRR
jgi:acylphosphatase